MSLAFSALEVSGGFGLLVLRSGLTIDGDRLAQVCGGIGISLLGEPYFAQRVQGRGLPVTVVLFDADAYGLYGSGFGVGDASEA